MPSASSATTLRHAPRLARLGVSCHPAGHHVCGCPRRLRRQRLLHADARRLASSVAGRARSGFGCRPGRRMAARRLAVGRAGIAGVIAQATLTRSDCAAFIGGTPCNLLRRLAVAMIPADANVGAADCLGRCERDRDCASVTCHLNAGWRATVCPVGTGVGNCTGRAMLRGVDADKPAWPRRTTGGVAMCGARLIRNAR